MFCAFSRESISFLVNWGMLLCLRLPIRRLSRFCDINNLFVNDGGSPCDIAGIILQNQIDLRKPYNGNLKLYPSSMDVRVGFVIDATFQKSQTLRTMF